MTNTSTLRHLLRILAGAVFFCVCAFPALTQERVAGPQEQAPGDAYTIQSSVDMVLLNVVVLGKNGGFVSGLDRNSFQVSEDGKPQAISIFANQNVPVDIGIVVDGSQSMQKKRMEVLGAAISFIQTCNPQDEFFVTNFNELISFGLPANKLFSSDLDQLKFALSRHVPIGQTALYDAISLSLKRLEKGNYEKRALLVITDGFDNASRTNTLEDTILQIRRSNATVYTIALFDPDDHQHPNPGLLKKFARISGGEFFKPATIQDTRAICQTIARDIRAQYTIGYNPSNEARDGTFRRIQVTASEHGGPKLNVRTREGYFAPGGPDVPTKEAGPGKSRVPSEKKP